MSKSDSKIAKNTFFLYIRMFLIVLVSLYTSRIVLNVLGVMDYGIYCVVGAFVSLFSFLNVTLSSSMQRFFNYDIGETNGSNISIIYSEGLLIHFLIAFFLFVILETFGLWYLNHIMVIPNDRLFAANVLYQFTIFSSILVILQIPYVGAILAFERMDFYALVSIFDVFFKLVIVILLPKISFDKIIVYGGLLFIISIIDLLCYFIYSKRHFSALTYCKNTSHTYLKDMISFSGWNLVGTSMFMIKTHTLSLLLNFYFNPIVNAARGLAIQVSGAVNGFSQNITVAYRPQITNSYACHEYSNVKRLMFSESKICYFLILFLMTPLLIEINFVLNIWLGTSVPDNTDIFIVLTLIDVLICTLNTPCTQIVFATGNIKRYQIATSFVNFSIMPAAWLLLYLGLGPNTVFILSIFCSVINQIVSLIITNKVFAWFSIHEYLKFVLTPALLSSVVLPIVPLIFAHLIDGGIICFFAVCLTTVIVGLPIFYFIVLTHNERTMLVNFLKKHD